MQIIFLRDVVSNIFNVIQSVAEVEQNIQASSTLVKHVQESLLILPSPSSPSQFGYPEDTTTTSTISVVKDNLNQGITEFK